MDGKWPTTGRLNTRFTAIGPYFRQKQSSDDSFFFDCLSECVSAEVEASQREFYGWWLILTKTKSCFEYDYRYGYYDAAGNWSEQTIPDLAVKSVETSLQDFYVKLCNELKLLSVSLSPSAAIEPTKTLSAA